MEDIKKKQQELESAFEKELPEIEAKAVSMPEMQARNFHTDYSVNASENTHSTWKKLGEYLLVKYMDGGIKIEEQGQFKRNEHGNSIYPKRPGYSEEQRRKIVEETGDKYKVLF